MVRVLYDAFFHMLPGHRVGRDIVVGGYQMNFGRYAPGDCYHPNGLAFLEAELAREFEIHLLHGPYTTASLYDADILFVTNPDYPPYQGTSPWRWEPEDVAALLEFCERGGSVVLLINSFLSRSDFWEENFDYERVSLLLNQMGIRWDPNYMSDDLFIERAQAGSREIGYGQGGRVFGGALPDGVKPLITYNDHVYGFTAPVGHGKLVVIGDAGMLSSGLVTFPGFENAAFVRDLFSRVTPTWCRDGIGVWDYRAYRHLSGAPSKNGLNEDLIRSLRPNATWQVDHHYRHLTWDTEEQKNVDRSVWEKLPVPVAELSGHTTAQTTIRSIGLDTDQPGRAFPLELAVRETTTRSGTEIHAIGRTRWTELCWQDLSESPERFRPAGEVEHVNAVFELWLILDSDGQPARAQWRQGQILFAKNPVSEHYGYEIMLASDSGVIVPRAREKGR
ncbi:MAG: hypothetical protein V1800_15150 [Candidatus Latescibacterota bacterium]